ncbi:MAG: hypothetical protein CMF25_05325 [Kangiellaceae bacterium]|nr:hypothetical protein [Kangiellaceae bacterium]|tara:strand:+ start:1672 stop:2376 length:705 start_codon:yes stop_codon:yes gene_type:complete
MKVYFTTYGDERFKFSRQRIVDEASKIGVFDKVFCYDQSKLNRWFNDAPANVLKVLGCKKGGGYWIWKPFCVLDALSGLNAGDALIYADAGCTIYPTLESKENLLNLIDETNRSDEGVMRFASPFNERAWTKRDVFDAIAPNEFNNINGKQLTANRFIIIKGSLGERQVEKWASYVMSSVSLFDDSKSARPSAAEFKQNRHDQSVFSLISKRYGAIFKTFDDIDVSIKATRIRQ